MGWLKDLAAERGFKSLRALAQAMRASDLWPPKDKRSAETVANKLRDADSHEDIRFWIRGKGRPLVPVLAEVLQEEEEDLLDRLQQAPAAAAAEAPAIWTFKVFPALRPLDLRSEKPFPGVPGELVRLGGPRSARTWWIAPSGAGRTLVGSWLALHYGWRFVQADRWADVDLAGQSRVFVELGSAADLTAEALANLPADVKICVAAPGAPPSPPRTDGTASSEDTVVAMSLGAASPPDPDAITLDEAATPAPAGSTGSRIAKPPWEILSPPSPRTWALDLVHWAAARIEPGGGFDARRLAALLRQESVVALFATPGDLLGFLGMVEHVGLDKLLAPRTRTTDRLRWIRAWLEAALARPDRRRPTGIAELLGERGPEILLEMELERFRRGLGPALLEREWIALVPRDHAPEVDRDRLLAAGHATGSDAATRLQAMLAMLAPDGASVVAGLKVVGALVEDGAGRLRLGPAWVGNFLREAVFDRLYEDAPGGLGALLVSNDTSDRALRRLIDEVRAGETARAAACVTADLAPSPEQMAALDGAFRAVGFALALDAQVPPPLVRAVWERQRMFLVQRFTNWPPVPLLTVAWQDHPRGTPTSIAAWFIAAFAISRALVDAGDDVGCAELDPWSTPPGKQDVRTEALVHAASAFRADEEIDDADPLRLTAYRVGGALLDLHGVVHRPRRVLKVQGPDLLVALAGGTPYEIGEQERQDLLQLRFGLAALKDACRRKSVELTSVLAWCWSTWKSRDSLWPPIEWPQRIGAPPPPDGLRFPFPRGARVSAEDVELLWRAAPAPALSPRFCEQLMQLPDVWPFLTAETWARCLEVWPEEWDDAAGAFRFVPEELALQAIRDGRLHASAHDIRSVLWARMPRALIELADELARLPPRPRPDLPGYGGPIGDLVFSTPAEHCPSVIERARTWLAQPASYPGTTAWLQRWLVRVIVERHPGWREAYGLMLEASRRTDPASGLRHQP